MGHYVGLSGFSTRDMCRRWIVYVIIEITHMSYQGNKDNSPDSDESSDVSNNAKVVTNTALVWHAYKYKKRKWWRHTTLLPLSTHGERIWQEGVWSTCPPACVRAIHLLACPPVCVRSACPPLCVCVRSTCLSPLRASGPLACSPLCVRAQSACPPLCVRAVHLSPPPCAVRLLAPLCVRSTYPPVCVSCINSKWLIMYELYLVCYLHNRLSHSNRFYSNL